MSGSVCEKEVRWQVRRESKGNSSGEEKVPRKRIELVRVSWTYTLGDDQRILDESVQSSLELVLVALEGRLGGVVEQVGRPYGVVLGLVDDGRLKTVEGEEVRNPLRVGILEAKTSVRGTRVPRKTRRSPRRRRSTRPDPGQTLRAASDQPRRA